MDEQSFDIAVAGMLTLSDNKTRQFFYYLDNSSCSVTHHYIFEKAETYGLTIVEEFKALAIRSSTDAVYGIISKNVDFVMSYYFLEAQLDPHFQEEVKFQLY